MENSEWNWSGAERFECCEVSVTHIHCSRLAVTLCIDALASLATNYIGQNYKTNCSS